MSTYSYWKNSFICGWNFDTIESVSKNYVDYYSQSSLDNEFQAYERIYDENLGKLQTETNVKLNLGGENDKAKIVFSDKPIGVFDFSLASQLLFRVQEFYSEELKKDEPNLFAEYDLPKGVVPNYFIQKELIGDLLIFFCISSDTGKRYNCEIRQKGLTKILETNPTLPTKKIGNMIVPEKPTKGVTFSSKTKKPYIKYLKRGGKVRYVEIYSLFYYSYLSSDFAKSMRHLPVVLVLKYLEKMGTMCKFYLTRFVKQGINSNENPREFDKTTGAKLPLFECVEQIGRIRFDRKLIVQPICVKEYGEEINEALIFGGSGNRENLYTATYYGMVEQELINSHSGTKGDPDHDDEKYQEGFERYRQKYIEYSKKGIWKTKEVTPQGLILFHDIYLNRHWDENLDALENSLKIKYPNFNSDWNASYGQWSKHAFIIGYKPETIAFFELWIKVSANIIKHKLDIFNSSNLRKTYQQVFRELETAMEEWELLIRIETNYNLKTFFENVFVAIKRYYRIDKPKIYCNNRINEMTFYAEGGCFATPDEDIEKREKEADRLREELLKM
jgi:hypothetical protein